VARSAEHPGAAAGRPRAARWLGAIVTGSVVLRVAAALYLGNSVVPMPGIYDQASYHALALRVLEGHGFTFGTGWWPATQAGEPTAHWSFLYVIFLSAVYGVAGPVPLAARLVQAIVVGVLQPLLTYRVASRLFGAPAGCVAAALAAGYAYFIYYTAALVTEPFYIVALLWSVDRALAVAGADGAVGRSRTGLWLQLGLALALAVLLRQVVLVVVPVILCWAAWRASRWRPRTTDAWRRLRAASLGMLAALLVIVAAVAPWTLRNYRAFHRFVLLNTNAGFAFYWGNHPVHGSTFVPILPEGVYGALIPDEVRHLDEAAMERALLRRGLAFVREDPGRFLRLSASRLEEYLKFWPTAGSGRSSNLARVLSFGVCLPLMIIGVVLACRGWMAAGWFPDGRAACGLIIAVAIVYSLVHLASWTLVRYRLPIDAILLPFAGFALVRAWHAVQLRYGSLQQLRAAP
jgi:hypothetical protein